MGVSDHQRVEWGAALRSNLEQLLDLHVIVGERLDKMKLLEKALEDANKSVERERSEEGNALGSLSSASEDAVRRARLIGVKMEAAFLEGRITEEAFRAALGQAFPQGGKLGTTPELRLKALRRIAGALDHHDAVDVDGSLRELANAGADAIEEANEEAKREQEQSRAAEDALAEARQRFDEGYQATKEIMSGLLRDAGRLDELRDVFPDM